MINMLRDVVRTRQRMKTLMATSSRTRGSHSTERLRIGEEKGRGRGEEKGRGRGEEKGGVEEEGKGGWEEMCILDLIQHYDCLLVLYLHSVTRIPVVMLNSTNISRAPTSRSTQVSTLLEACSFENTSCECEFGRGMKELLAVCKVSL